MWDIIILILLLVQRSLQKSKGIWNFISIKKEYLKTPIFEIKKANPPNQQEGNSSLIPLGSDIDSVNSVEINQSDNI